MPSFYPYTISLYKFYENIKPVQMFFVKSNNLVKLLNLIRVSFMANH